MSDKNKEKLNDKVIVLTDDMDSIELLTEEEFEAQKGSDIVYISSKK